MVVNLLPALFSSVGVDVHQQPLRSNGCGIRGGQSIKCELFDNSLSRLSKLLH